MKAKHETTEDYARKLYNRNVASIPGFNASTLILDDIIHHAEFAGADEASARKIIRDGIIIERRKIIAKIQRQDDTLAIKEKKCKACEKLKSISNFAEKLDKRAGMKYYNSLCRKCQTEHNTATETREKRRAQYAGSETAKEKAHLRYLKFKAKSQSHENTKN